MVRLFVLLLSLSVAAPAGAESVSDPIAARGGAKRKRGKKRLEYRPMSNPAIEVFNEGIEAFNNADPKEAEAKFRQVLEREPLCGMAMELLGRSLLRQQKPDDAIAVLTEATELFPRYPDPWAALSDAWFAKGDFDAALAVSERGLLERPDSVEILETLTSAAIRLGKYELALKRLRSRRLRGPDRNVECLEVLVRVEMEDLTAAQKSWAKCQLGDPRLVLNAKNRIEGEVDPDELKASRRMEAIGVDGAGDVGDAVAAYNQEEYVLASAILDKILAMHPEKIDARVIRARVREALDEPELALEDLELALQSEDWVQVSKSGAVSGVITKRGEEALLDGLMEGSALMVRLLAAKGRVEEARAQLARAREAFGDQPAFVAAESRIVLAEAGANRWSAMADLLLAHPDDRDVQLDAADLVFEHGGEAPDAILHPLRRATEPTALFNVAAGLGNAKRWTECVEFSKLHLARADQLQAAGGASEEAKAAFGQTPRTESLAYSCSLHGRRLGDARELLKRIGPSSVSVDNASGHVVQLWDAKRYKEAWAVLVDTKLLDRDPAWSTPMAINLHVELGTLDQALFLAKTPHSRPGDQAYVSHNLYKAGRLDDALVLLEMACPKLEGEDKTDCEHNLKVIGQER